MSLIPVSSIVSRSAPAGLDRYPRGFTGHVADPSAPLYLARVPLARRYLAALPAMSLIPQLHSSGDSANLVKYILACPQLNIVQFAKFRGTAQCRKPGSGGP